MISSITIFGGNNKFGEKEKIHKIEIREGEIIGIVGPTGSGKSALIEDIEQLAQTDTGTGRRVLINNSVPNENTRSNPKLKLGSPAFSEYEFFGGHVGNKFPRIALQMPGQR